MSRLGARMVHARFLPSAILVAMTILGSAGRTRGAEVETVIQSWGRELNPPRVGEQSEPPVAGQKASEAVGARKELKGYTLPPEKYAQAVRYSRAQYRLYFIGVAYELLILLAVLGGRVAPRLRNLAEGASPRRLLQVVVYAPLLLGVLGVLGLPVEIYGHRLSLDYQQSVQGWASWFWDWAKGQFLQIVAGTFLAWILYGIMRRSPRGWWLYFWLASIPLVVFLLFIAPVIIDPLFYKFEPLARTQPALVEEISKVVAHGGLRIPPDRMFEMKASEKLNAVDAYMTGLGASQRVVVWDTTISKMTVPETLSVFGHEMGHYVLRHIPKGIAFFCGLLFAFLYVGFRGLAWTLARWGTRWDIRSADDWASLPILLMLVSLFSFFASPITNGFSRYQEHQADVYGLEVIHGLVPNSQQVAAEAFQVLGEIDLADPSPSPFIKLWLYSHPPLSERLAFALSYDPWSKGQPPEFVKQ